MVEENSSAQAWVQRLAYLGLVPMIGCVAGIWLGESPLYKQQMAVLFVYYSTIVLSFMSGTLWGALIPCLNRTPQATMTLFLINGIALTAWAVLLMDLVTAAGLLFIGFALILAYEHRLPVGEQFPNWYHKMRRRLTAIVLGLHVLYGFALFR